MSTPDRPDKKFPGAPEVKPAPPGSTTSASSTGTLTLGTGDQVAPDRTSTYGCLIVYYGWELGLKFNLAPGDYTVGRSVDAQIHIPLKSISRLHLKMLVNRSGSQVTDLGSKNGCYINGLRLHGTQTLRNGDFLQLGDVIFKFLEGEAVELEYHEAIHRLVVTDGLTGVANRRAFDESLEHEVRRARRFKRPLSLVLLDIDHFKNLNDEHGHLVGDLVLRELADVVVAQVREAGDVARYGGEEFAVILVEAGLDEARAVAERIRQAVAEHAFTHDGLTFPVTVSIGVAALDDGIKSATDLIRVTDERLYQAKESGRNRTV